MTEIAIPLRSNPGAFKLLGEPKLVNAYAEATGQDNKAPYALFPCAGLVPVGTDAVGACRGMITLEEDNKLYAVLGATLYDVASNGTKTSKGLVGGTSPVYIARNDAATTQVMIVNGDDNFTFVLESGTLTIQKLEDEDGNVIVTPSGVTQCGGYFVLWNSTSGEFYASLLNSTTFEALRFATAEADPDGLTCMIGQVNNLYAVGTSSIEVWTINGGSDFPFSRQAGAHLRFGSKSPHTVVDFDQSIAMVASDNTVRLVSGYQNRVISNNEVARLIEAEADPANLYAFTYQRGVNKFYCLQGTGWTREYNAATDSWHHRYSGTDQPWKAAFTARAFGSDWFGCREANGRTFTGSYSTFVEDGEPFHWGFDTAVFHGFPNGISFERLDIDMEVGAGLSVDQAGLMMLEWSDDNGRTWTGYRTASLGKQGAYKTRVRFHNLGTCDARGRTWRVRISDAVARAVTLMDVQAQPVEL